MKTYSLQLADDRLITYQDRKRYLWLLSMLYPLLALSGVGLYLLTGSEWLLLTPLVSIYGGASLFDWLLGTDKSNPPEELVPQLEEDPYYRWLPMLTVPLHIVVLVVIAGFTATHDLSWLSILVLALTAGLYSGLAINTAHELGHKKTELERRLARHQIGKSPGSSGHDKRDGPAGPGLRPGRCGHGCEKARSRERQDAWATVHDDGDAPDGKMGAGWRWWFTQWPPSPVDRREPGGREASGRPRGRQRSRCRAGPPRRSRRSSSPAPLRLP